MTFSEFHNALRILMNIDRNALIAGEVIRENDENGWRQFRSDPFRWLIRAPDREADALFKIIKQQMGGTWR